jgi:hypothetical protein
MNWLFENKEFTSEEIGDYVGFVYLITDLKNNKMYVGKKNFWSIRKLPPLKGQKRKRTKKAESDWKNYFGSSEAVKLLVEEYGQDSFKREILRLCKTKGEMSYFELYHQMINHVLLDETYYNAFVGCKIHANHVKALSKADFKNI